MAKIHMNGKGSFMCQVCDLLFSNSPDLHEHLNTTAHQSKGFNKKRKVDNKSKEDANDPEVLYQLPDKISEVNDSKRETFPKAKTLETFIRESEASSDVIKDKPAVSVESVIEQNTFGHVACKAMEVLYSGDPNIS